MIVATTKSKNWLSPRSEVSDSLKKNDKNSNQGIEVFRRNVTSYPVERVESLLMTDKRVNSMRFRSFRSFDKTCLNLQKIEKTLRYNFDRMQPIIQRNLKKTEYLLLEP